MVFIESVKNCFKKYATFSGRASRSEFWYFILFIILTIITAFFLAYIERKFLLYLSSLTALTLLPFFAVLTRRLHDLDISGWWLIKTLIYLIIIMLFAYITNIPVMMVILLFSYPNLTIYLGYLTGFIFAAVAIYIPSKKGTIGDNRFGADPLQKNTQNDKILTE